MIMRIGNGDSRTEVLQQSLMWNPGLCVAGRGAEHDA